jgi:hypothetical protein
MNPNLTLEIDVELPSRLAGKLRRRKIDIAFLPEIAAFAREESWFLRLLWK